ncbi:MAG: DUF3150 domain-containing protein [Kiritimatiellia bacterium]
MQTNQNLLDVLTREGVLISVNVSYWRAAKKLQPQDLGLDPDEVTDRLISLGHKRLVPKGALATFAATNSFARESPRKDKGISSPLRGVANRLKYPYHKITFKNMTCSFNMGLCALSF